MKNYHIVLITLIAGLMVGAAVPAKANDNFDASFKAESEMTAYISCAFFGDQTSLGNPNSNSSVPSSTVNTFRLAALKKWRESNKLLGTVTTGDDEIISFSEVVAAQEALGWDKPGMNSRSVVEFHKAAWANYNGANCSMLLESIQ